MSADTGTLKVHQGMLKFDGEITSIGNHEFSIAGARYSYVEFRGTNGEQRHIKDVTTIPSQTRFVTVGMKGVFYFYRMQGAGPTRKDTATALVALKQGAEWYFDEEMFREMEKVVGKMRTLRVASGVMQIALGVPLVIVLVGFVLIAAGISRINAAVTRPFVKVEEVLAYLQHDGYSAQGNRMAQSL